jgi:hypothetical protein
MTTVVHKPAVVVEDLGEFGRLPDGGIINAGGVSGHFTVDGKAVILADGTASDGSGPVIVVAGSVAAAIVGYEHVQATPSTLWVIQHNRHTRRVQMTIWDANDEMVWTDVKIIDLNTVHATFSEPVAGRADLVLF